MKSFCKIHFFGNLRFHAHQRSVYPFYRRLIAFSSLTACKTQIELLDFSICYVNKLNALFIRAQHIMKLNATSGKRRKKRTKSDSFSNTPI